MMKKNTWSACKHLLCFRPDNIGDIIMTQPALRALKETFHSRLALLTSESGAAIAPSIPEIDEVIACDLPWIKSERTAEREQTLQLIQQLKKSSYDGAIIFTNFSQDALPTALLAYLAGIPRILAYSLTNPYHLLTDWVPDPDVFSFPRHAVSRQLELVRTIGAQTDNDFLSLKIPETTALRVETILSGKGIDLHKPFLILHAGASEEKRQFALTSLAEAARQLIRDAHYQILLTGVTSENALINRLHREIGQGSFSLAGALTVEEFIAVISLSDLLITNNTGPAHIAAAVGTPILDLYARTNPEHTPWKAQYIALYFDVPEKMQSKNQLLRRIIPRTSKLMPTADDIVLAAKKLLAHEGLTDNSLPQEVVTWA